MSHYFTKENDYWIGLKDKGNDIWYWIYDNATVDNRNEIWQNAEPENDGKEGCAVLSVRNSVVRAGDENCSLSYYGICEKRALEN